MDRNLIRKACSSLALTGLLLAASAPAMAEGAVRIAPPGPCAEPREAMAVGMQDGGGEGEDSPLSLVGPLQSFFTPNDVAASPLPTQRPIPVAAAIRRPGGCEPPNLGACQQAAPPGNPPVGSGGRPTPGGAVQGPSGGQSPQMGAGGPPNPPIGAGQRPVPN